MQLTYKHHIHVSIVQYGLFNGSNAKGGRPSEGRDFGHTLNESPLFGCSS